MKKILVFLSVLLTSGCLSKNNHASNEDQPADYIVEKVQVITMNSPVVLTNKAVLIQNNKIVKIIDQKNAKEIKARQRIYGGNRYLMPGLADMHVHVRWDPQAMFNLFLANGVTTVVNMRMKDGGFDHLDLREKIRTGEISGPRYLLSGDHLEGGFPGSLDEVEQVLDDHVARTIDFVKIHGDLKPEIYEAIITGANKRGLKTVGHAQHNMPLKSSLSLGSLEHMEEFLYVALDGASPQVLATDFPAAYRDNVKQLQDKNYRNKLVEAVAASGIYLDPTLIVYKMVGIWQSDEHLAALQNQPELRYLADDVKTFWLNPATNPYQAEDFPITKAEVDSNLELLLQLTKEMHDKGVPLLTGTDSFGTLIPGISLHDELELLVAAGLSPFEALRSSTVNVASYLGEKNSAGTIEAGKRADFILLDANPLVNIKNSRQVSGVFTQGRWLSREVLANSIDAPNL